jgi:hypothetical protein
VKPLKNPKTVLLVLLFAIAVAASVPQAHSSTLTLTVFTDRTIYTIDEGITVFGNLTYNGSPVADWPVALEIQDPTGTPVVTRTPQTDISGTYSLTFKLSTDAKRNTYTVYVSSSYKGETATSNRTFRLVNLYEATITIEGEDYTIAAESNATMINATATRTVLNFTSSGSGGETAYVNVTVPIGLNRTGISVFIDNNEVVPPPFPSIASNGSHYLVYFEFTLSTHSVAVVYAVANVGVSNVTPAKTVVGQGYTIRINTTIENLGDYEETLNVTVYANTTSIASQNVTLSSGNSMTITFTWNTTGFAVGNYTISGSAWPVPGNNTLVDSSVFVTIPGDIKGDKVVDIYDAILLANAFNTRPDNSNWNPNADINGDNVVDIYDAIILANHYNQHYP